MKIIFVSIFLLVFVGMSYYIHKRFIHKLHIRDKFKRYFDIFLLINFIGVVIYMVGRYYQGFPHWLYFMVSLPIGVLFLLFCTAVIYDISHSFLHILPISSSRRAFFKKGFDFLAVAIVGGATARGVYEVSQLDVEPVAIKIGEKGQTYRIVQLSDVHIGGLIDEQYIASMVQRVNKLQPDIVVITGDLVDTKLQYAQKALEELQALSSKYGTYFIVGNHEYFHAVEQIIDTLKSLKITVLENSSVYIGEKDKGFNLAGVYDVMGERVGHHKPDLSQALQTRKSNSPTVLLAHQPRYIKEVQKSDNIGLVLSGHTHGGQIYPFRALVKLQQPYISGLYKHTDSTQIYVNRGTGFWGPPMRLGATPEITYITLEV
jgi:predicted MPP superfamily phosphohydrolase